MAEADCRLYLSTLPYADSTAWAGVDCAVVIVASGPPCFDLHLRKRGTDAKCESSLPRTKLLLSPHHPMQSAPVPLEQIQNGQIMNSPRCRWVFHTMCGRKYAQPGNKEACKNDYDRCVPLCACPALMAGAFRPGGGA